MNKPTTEIMRRVWVENERACLEIKRFPYAPKTTIELSSTSNKSKEWFGQVSVVMSKEYARELGEALIAASKE